MPTYVNSGRTRATKLTIQPMNYGVPVGDPISPSMLEQFTLNSVGTFAAISVDELRRLPDLEYMERADVFVAYVKSIHAVDMPGLGNPTNVPIM